jgi:hypothetical protein
LLIDVIGNTLAKSESQDNQALEAESEDYGSETGLITEADTSSTGVVATGTGGVGAAETSRNPYKWEDEGRSSATATSGWSGSETTDLADTVSSLAREGKYRDVSMRMWWLIPCSIVPDW